MNSAVAIFRKKILPYSETFIADQSRFLSKYNVSICGLQQDQTGLHMLDDMNTCVLDQFASNSSLSKFLFRIGMVNKAWIDCIEENSPNLIHAHFLNDGLDALSLKNILDVPLVTTLHGHDITKKEKTSLFSKTRADFFDSVDKIIAVSDYIYRKTVQAGCPESKIIKHSIGIDLEKFTQEKIESNNPEILFVGRLVEKKGCIYLLEALKHLQQDIPEVSLTIVGDGPLKPMLESVADEYKLQVNFVGRESAQEIRNRLSSAWVFAAPSITADNGDAEGLGMVFLEAQALKTPVVSFSSGGVVEAVEDGETGILSAEKDVQGLYEALKYFLQDNVARKEYGFRGRNRVEQNFDIRKQCQLLEEIYDGLR